MASEKKVDISGGIFLTFLLFFLLAVSSICQANPRTNSYQYNILDEWKKDEGLPQNSVTAITQTADGYLWFGTTDGLARFDGIHFSIFNSSNNPQFKTNRISCLFPDRDGSLWIGTEGGGLLHYQDQKFTLYTTEDGLASNYVTEIIQDSKSSIWIGTPDKSLCSFQNNNFIKYGSESGLKNENIQSLLDDDTGTLWVGTYGGLYKLRNDEFERIDLGENPIGSIISKIYQDREGLIWIGSNNGLAVIENSQVKTIARKEDGLLSQWITAITSNRRGNVWVGTTNGLQIITKDRKGNLGIEKVLDKIPVTGILEDHEHSMWITILGDGVKRFRAGKFLGYTFREGLSNSLPLSLFEDSERKLWVGLNNGEINILDPEKDRFHAFSKQQINSSDGIRAICQDRTGNIWIGSYGGGMYKYDHAGRIRKFTETDGLISNLARTLYVDSRGTLWIGTRFGLSVLAGGRFVNYTTEQGLPSNIILCIREDNKGKIWVGTGEGIACFFDKRFESFPLEGNLASLPVLSIFPDEAGVLWVGTEGGGLVKIEGKTSTSINISNGLPSNIICNILEDEHQSLWLATDKGILQVSKEELKLVCERRKAELNYRYYDTSDGLPSNECGKWSQYSILKRKDGSLWFVTINGLCMIDPENIMLNKTPPPVRIEEIFVDGGKIPPPIRDKPLSPKNTISFKFTALTFISPLKVKFRYMLENHDHDWIEIQPGKKRRFTYRKLKSGRYTFRITACNSDGVWNPKGDAVSFNIKKAFTRNPYFFLLLVFLILFSGSSVYFLRARKLFVFSSKKYKFSTLSPEKKDEYLEKIMEVLEKEKIYREEKLTLGKLSEILSIPTHHLSQVINEKLQKNFNDLINTYRIEEAKKKLLESEKERTTILEIAYDVGFNSKSVFNQAFKKYTGMTPSRFRKKSGKRHH